MRIRRKNQRCLNCGTSLGEVYNFCPKCGQENNDHNVTLRTLIAEFFSNYFGVDSRFSSTFKPFFLKPGFLTNRFNEGKRKAYVHPIRLYLVISLLYFFVLGLVGGQMGSWREIVASATADGDDYKISLSGFDASDQKALAALDSLLVDSVVTDSAVLDTLRSLTKQLARPVPATDSALADSTSEEGTLKSGTTRLTEFLTIMRDLSLTDSAARVQLEMDTEGGEREFTQLRKIAQSDLSIFVGSIIQNIPVMMFFMIPLFALLLRLWYVRAKVLYIQHVIHGLHLHAFAYTVFSVATLFMLYTTDAIMARFYLGLFAFLVVSVYSYLSFLRVYQQGWFKTLVKFFLQGFIYIVVLFFSAAVALFATFYLY